MNVLHNKRFAVLILSVFFIGCGNSYKMPGNKNGTEDFNAFLEKFYSDTVFQKSRICFPLAGERYWFSLKENKPEHKTGWREEEWQKIDNIFPDNDTLVRSDGNIYKRRFINKDSVRVEYVFIEYSGYEETRKFCLRNKKWYLIRYDMSNV